MKNVENCIEILKGQLIAASCQREPKLSITIESCKQTLDTLDNLVKKSDSLLPCPFCKSIDVEYEFSCSQGIVKCNNCGVEGPEVSEAADPICSISAAREAWNNR